MKLGNADADPATSDGNVHRRGYAKFRNDGEEAMEMMLKKLLHIGAALFLGGQGVLAIVGVVTFMTQAAPPQIDGYGVTPQATAYLQQSTR
jgi:hypothetical protein